MRHSGQTRFRTTVIDANLVHKEQFRDVRSQIVTVNEFNKGAVFHTSYAYDPVRQITGVTDDQGNVTSVAYDLFGRRTAINSPDAGRTTFSYDLADNLTAKQTANLRANGQQQVTFGYQFNRVTSITYPNFPGNNVTYTYGAAAQRGQGTPLVGNVLGRITHITDGAGTEDRQYGPASVAGEMLRVRRRPSGLNAPRPVYWRGYLSNSWLFARRLRAQGANAMPEHVNTDEIRITALLETWADAVRRHDIPAILAHHEPDMVMFDLPPPLQCKGIEAYERTWDLFFRYHTPGTAFDIHDLVVTAGQDVAFCGRDHALRPQLVQQPGGQRRFPVPANHRPAQGRR